MRYTGVGIASAIFIALLPFVTTNSIFYGSVGAKFFFIVAFTGVLLLWGAYLVFKGKVRLPLRHRPLLYAFSALLVVQYLALALGVHPARSWWSDLFWMDGVFFLTHVAALAVLLSAFLTARDWSLVRRTIALSAGLVGFIVIFGAAGAGYAGKFLWLDMSVDGLSFGNATYAGVYLLLAFVLGLIELLRTNERKWRCLLLAALACIAVSPIMLNIGIVFGKTALSDALINPVLLLGSARASSAALLTLLAYLIGRYALPRFVPARALSRAQFGWAALLVVGAAAGIGLLFTPGSIVQEAYIKSSTAARIIVWERGMDAVRERPFFGWGPENFNYALERHFDNRLFLDENIGEIWFDQAHNFFVDTLVSTGAAGLLASLVAIATFVAAVYRGRKRALIGEDEAVLLYALPALHLLQLQTGFDTVSTYALLGFIAAYALWLEAQLSPEPARPALPATRTAIALVLSLAAVASFMFAAGELSRERAMVRTFSTSGNREAQQEALRTSLSRTSSFESLRLSSLSFLKGALMSIAQNNEPARVKRILEFMSVYEKRYETYLIAAPEHYRARMNYAYLLLIKTTLGENRLADAKKIIQASYRLSPQNPLTYIMESLAELYGGNLAAADRLMKAAVALNPDVEFTQEAAAYLEKQKRQFPNITVLKLGNL